MWVPAAALTGRARFVDHPPFAQAKAAPHAKSPEGEADLLNTATADAARGLLISVRRRLGGVLAPDRADWLHDWPPEPTRAVRPSRLPVLRHLTASPELLCLEWRQTYGVAEMGQAFLDNYGWAELIGRRGPIASMNMLCGFLLLGPKTLYRRHRHAAEELYVPLSGTAEWFREDGGWHAVPPGGVLHHPPWLPHATRTGAEPLLALYVWRGAGLDAKSELL